MGWMSRLMLLAVLMLPMTTAAPAQPAANAADRAEAIRRVFLELWETDPTRRQQAREALMGLRMADLDNLRAIASEYRPLEPGVMSELRDVVIHIHVSGQKYDAEKVGFLGISMPATPETPDDMQVMVLSRWPGFAAFRWLRDGDVILDIEEHPLGRPSDRAQFIDNIKRVLPGQTVHLKVVRGGRKMRIAVKLTPRPLSRDGMELEEIGFRLVRAAEEYWRTIFLPGLGEQSLDDQQRAGT